ncbi:dTDP-D-glucose 4,6-dehydratase-like isoform X3 [Salvelinus namaycush]|uniref:dTDP-D-glucose 4,6-dehydratase-like isoform X3 n=1 Tax=Salvelinus namaycush TaxID=8040 RepID=A0A8U0Q2E9_SALNM|nr:dTDP-D-glucose 4,6-dehydratase-like isoform X3 [Salvelinus namaycush]
MDFVKTVLVTGGAGFIGSHFVCSLVNRHPDWRIINFDNGDICNPRLVNHIFATENIDIVFHFAAQTHVETSFIWPSRYHMVNVGGTRVLLKAAFEAKVEKFIYISTDEVYGESLYKELDETSPRRPNNPYSVSKAAAECLVLSYRERHKFPVIITRSNNVYGPRQYLEKVIPKFVSFLQLNKKCTIQGTSPQSRHFLYVDDAIEAFHTILERGVVGETYNIGTDFEISIIQLARELIKMCVLQVKHVPDAELDDWLEFVPDRPVVDLRYPVNCEKLWRLGWKPAVSWSEGIRRTVKWYQENPDFWPDVKPITFELDTRDQ